MYERFTDRARQVIQLANGVARRLNHEFIGTEHILLGLIAAETGVATTVLKNLGVELQKVRVGVENQAPPKPILPVAETKPKTSGVMSILRSVVGIGSRPKRLAMTLRAKKVIQYAMEAARHFKHNYVGTEHLLLGLLREQDGVAAQTLRNLGVRFEPVEDEIMRLLDPSAPHQPDAQSLSSCEAARRTYGVGAAGRPCNSFSTSSVVAVSPNRGRIFSTQCR